MFTFAYIDAGTGSLLAQLLVGGLAGLATFVKYRWGTVKQLFRRTSNVEQD
jgi:hypothetical protein